MPSVDQFIAEVQWEPRTGGQMNLDVSSATGLTVPSDSQAALIQAQGGAIRYRDDGTSPTATTGVLISDGSAIFYTGDLSAIEFIQDDGAGTITVLYYGWSDA